MRSRRSAPVLAAVAGFWEYIEMYSRNLSAPAFAADFPPDAPKFNQRTLHVRLINLCTSDKKSSHKIRHSEIPRVHYEAEEEIQARRFA